MKWKTNIKKTGTANPLTSCMCSDTDSNNDIKACFDEPIADEALLDNYGKKCEEGRERRIDFELRRDENKSVSTWYTYKINFSIVCLKYDIYR